MILMKTKIILTCAGLVLSLNGIIAQSPIACDRTFQPIVELNLTGNQALSNSRLIYVLDGELFTTAGRVTLQDKQAVALPPLDLETGVHVLEIYWEEGTQVNPPGVSAQFVAKTDAEILQKMEQEVLTYDAFKADDECPCLKHVDQKAPLASFWYYLVKTDVGDEMLFYAYGGGEDWQPADVIQGDCPSFAVPTPQGSWIIGAGLPLEQRIVSPTPTLSSAAIQLSAYPNPFEEYVDLEMHLPSSNLPISVKVVEAGSGRQIYTVEAPFRKQQQMMRLKTHTWASGIYLLTLTQGDQSHSLKLIKTN